MADIKIGDLLLEEDWSSCIDEQEKDVILWLVCDISIYRNGFKAIICERIYGGNFGNFVISPFKEIFSEDIAIKLKEDLAAWRAANDL